MHPESPRSLRYRPPVATQTGSPALPSKGVWAIRATKTRRLWNDAFAIRVLAPTLATRVLTVVGVLGFPIWRRLTPRPLGLPITVGALRRFNVADRQEIELVRAVLAHRQYAIVEIPDDGVVVDLGANVGTATAFFRAHSSRARIIAVEPDPETCSRLRANVGSLPDVEVIEAAVTDQDGTVALRRTDSSWSASLNWGDHGEVEVRAVRLQTLLSELDIGEVDLLKVDVEGSEYRIVESFHDWSRMRCIVIEVHGPTEPVEDALRPTHDLRWVETEDERLLVGTRRKNGRSAPRQDHLGVTGPGVGP